MSWILIDFMEIVVESLNAGVSGFLRLSTKSEKRKHDAKNRKFIRILLAIDKIVVVFDGI